MTYFRLKMAKMVNGQYFSFWNDTLAGPVIMGLEIEE
jgi:hypothetical protein